MILMNEKGRSWPAVSWNKKSDGQVYIGRGWTSFRDANNLKAGDSFIFEHIEKQKIPTFKFHSKLSSSSCILLMKKLLFSFCMMTLAITKVEITT